jgi:peptidylprolyl isomerase/peptidyl-prolyl cis-trans isomerase C
MTEAAANPWLALKLARELYGKAPQALEAAESRRVATVARRQAEIERRILATVEAAGVVLPATAVDRAIDEIRARYADEDEYLADLARADLSPAALRAAVERDLVVEAVLERVAGRAAAVGDTDVEIFYLQNRAKFAKPETRVLRHVLVTINDSLPGSERAAALAKIADILARLRKDPARFAEQALKHSECPTAMNGGLLGTLPRGKLYAALDAAAFALPAGGLSEIVESPLGFHLLLCEAIHPARAVPLAEARERVRAHLAETRRQAAQKAWVAGLFEKPRA